MSVIISNTTPINYLVLIDHITVLHHLYTHVIIPHQGVNRDLAGARIKDFHPYVISRHAA